MPHELASAGVVRHVVVADLQRRRFPTDFIDDVALVVGELIGNALRHARPLPGDGVEVTWDCRDSSVLVTVHDGGSGTEPATRTVSDASIGGRGLTIVDLVADEWGAVRDDGGTTVWARIAPGYRVALPTMVRC